MMLADASIPSGIVLTASTSQLPRSRPDFAAAASPDVAIEELSKVFNASHSTYRSTIMKGVLVIHAASGLPGDLQKSSGLKATAVTGVISAARTVLARLDPTIDQPGGILGSTISLDSEQRGDSVRIVFDGTERQVVDGLNAIVRQAKTTWLVVVSDDDDAPRVVKAGFLYRGGTSAVVDVRAADN
jgi:hypothetical protein